MVRYGRVSVRFRCVLGRISVRVLRKLRYGGISRRPFRRSAGGSGTRFFRKNHDFCKFIFASLEDCLGSPGVAFGEILASFGVISVRSGPHFGADPS